MSALIPTPARIRAVAANLAPYATVAFAAVVYVLLIALADMRDHTGAIPVAVVTVTGTDPCVTGEPADQTYYADGTPAPALPCPVSVQHYGPGAGH